MDEYLRGAIAALPLLLVAGCGLFGHDAPPHPHATEKPWRPVAAMLLPYAGPDGSLTRAQLEAGLRRDFAKADIDHNGCLDANEARIVNDQRWQQDASAASPLIDFQHNGCVDFNEYAAAPRTLFEQLDRNGDGKLTPEELKGESGKASTPQQQPSGGHSHHGGGSNGASGGN